MELSEPATKPTKLGLRIVRLRVSKRRRHCTWHALPTRRSTLSGCCLKFAALRLLQDSHSHPEKHHSITSCGVRPVRNVHKGLVRLPSASSWKHVTNRPHCGRLPSSSHGRPFTLLVPSWHPSPSLPCYDILSPKDFGVFETAVVGRPLTLPRSILFYGTLSGGGGLGPCWYIMIMVECRTLEGGQPFFLSTTPHLSSITLSSTKEQVQQQRPLKSSLRRQWEGKAVIEKRTTFYALCVGMGKPIMHSYHVGTFACVKSARILMGTPLHGRCPVCKRSVKQATRIFWAGVPNPESSARSHIGRSDPASQRVTGTPESS